MLPSEFRYAFMFKQKKKTGIKTPPSGEILINLSERLHACYFLADGIPSNGVLGSTNICHKIVLTN